MLAGLAQFFFTFPFRCLAGFLLTNLFLSCLFLPGQTLGFLPFNFPTQPFTPLGFALFPLFLRFPFPCLALGFLPFPTFFFFSFALLLFPIDILPLAGGLLIWSRACLGFRLSSRA